MDWNFIREKNEWFDTSRVQGPLTLDNLSLGKAIAKGCNGVVYEAKFKAGKFHSSYLPFHILYLIFSGLGGF